MLLDTKPTSGLLQPTVGCETCLRFPPMPKGGKTGQTRSKKRPGVLRFVLGANIVARLAELYPGIAKTKRQEKLAGLTGMSVSSIQRLCDGAVGGQLDNIEHVAGKLKTSVVALLTPNEQTKLALNLGAAEVPSEDFRGIPSTKRDRRPANP